jgi:hypothetical protein
MKFESLNRHFTINNFRNKYSIPIKYLKQYSITHKRITELISLSI